MSGQITLEINDPVAVITLDNPGKLNAIDNQMVRDLREAVAEANSSKEVVGIVLTGAGRGFCAGLDVAELAAATTAAESGPGQVSGARQTDPHGLFTYLLETDKPVIAAVNGPAAGGGVVLAAAADVRIFGASGWCRSVFLERGLIGEHTITWMLARQIGTGNALDWLWRPDKITAEEALQAGFAQRVVPDEQLLEVAVGYVEAMAARMSPSAMRLTKQLVYRHTSMSLRNAAADSDTVGWQAIGDSDAREAMAAMGENRPPRFGRLGDGT
ncbi:enoyl-CoA hydratase/carnithine racemase [Antricoccus suffuscus]|uniref:Enoyl-CoA hydratase/carnithine racemase n=1 Tax=Antricoccus suffuscus TaxID=1629062 RepID=A0A2T1A6E4_9ACTN|nr:enoyl-CoA hydratase-related protein [Antricoccus suffuscus]PRZ44047.1 enoyl-CoA hydratase/carnithine racemase [Antricoccus suffuscus]